MPPDLHGQPIVKDQIHQAPHLQHTRHPRRVRLGLRWQSAATRTTERACSRCGFARPSGCESVRPGMLILDDFVMRLGGVRGVAVLRY